MIWIYGVGYVVGTVMGLFNIHVLYRLLTGQLREDELVQVVDSEDVPHRTSHETAVEGRS
jgi:TRAP-type C4-dicarboxylate transport system permease small subunit